MKKIEVYNHEAGSVSAVAVENGTVTFILTGLESLLHSGDDAPAMYRDVIADLYNASDIDAVERIAEDYHKDFQSYAAGDIVSEDGLLTTDDMLKEIYAGVLIDTYADGEHHIENVDDMDDYAQDVIGVKSDARRYAELEEECDGDWSRLSYDELLEVLETAPSWDVGDYVWDRLCTFYDIDPSDYGNDPDAIFDALKAAAESAG